MRSDDKETRDRAGRAAPASLRRRPVAGDVTIASRSQPHEGFFAVEEQELRHRRFDGGLSVPLHRTAFISGDVVTVLPYDPARDRVLLVEQFRFAPHVRGDANPWKLEAIAGRIDAGEAPEQAARREAREEAGLVLDALVPIGEYYPSPGAFVEYIYSYLAVVDLPDSAAGQFGLVDEAEDIRAHLVSFEHLLQLCQSGEVDNAPLILSALWLSGRRGALRGQQVGQG